MEKETKEREKVKEKATMDQCIGETIGRRTGENQEIKEKEKDTERRRAKEKENGKEKEKGGVEKHPTKERQE